MGKEGMLRQTIVSLVIFAVFFSLILFQYSPERRFTLFFINKALAQSAVILIGLSFLLGPMAKIFHKLSHFVHYRKYLGLLGFLIVILHIDTSLLQIFDRFPLQWYGDHIVGVAAAIIASLIFLVLAITSYDPLIHKLGGHRWKTVQRTGYIALVLALIHIYVAASGRWQQWMAGEVAMPTSYLVFVFGILVLFARLVALIIDRSKAKTQAIPPAPQ